jgi:hypothetical protein
VAENERSVGELLKDITREFNTLIREEVALAKAEIQQTIRTAVKDVVFVAAGGLVAFVGFLVLIAAAVLALANVIAPWLSALIIGGVITLIGVILLMRGLSEMSSLSPVPKRSVRNVQSDADTVREKLS